MTRQNIKIDNANVHNLKSVCIEIPKNQLVVITGPSGSGKSSLAFDTIYVEGQRRYIESLSSYARQFLGQYQPPDVESITGLSPAIAIDQKSSSRNPRSTVGTITEVYDYLRVLFARAGTLYCHQSGKEIKSYSPPQITRELFKLKEKTRIHILAPIKTESDLKNIITKYRSLGFGKIRINGDILSLDEEIKIKKKIKSIEIIIDRFLIKPGNEKRSTDSIEHALKLSEGIVYILADEDLLTYSEKNVSPVTGEILPALEPSLFSFNSPLGACRRCNGLGESKTFDPNLMIFDESLRLFDGAITPLTKKNNFLYKMIESIVRIDKVDATLPYRKLPSAFKKLLFEGSNKVYKYSFSSDNSTFEFKKPFPGMIKWFEKKFKETTSEKVRKSLEEYMNIQRCPDCQGKRLNQIALSVTINNKNIIDLSELPIDELYEFFKNLKLKNEKQIIAKKLNKEISSRLNFLIDVGLTYLSLNRSATTLSGGENQRIRLATQIGSTLSGVLYVLDEPSIGLHQRDNNKLITTLKKLRDIGNSVLVVEHDEETIRNADFIIDMGPGAGIHGGNIIAKGSLEQIKRNKASLTAKYLTKKFVIDLPKERRKLGNDIILKGATQNNINKLDVNFPLGGIVCVTGVSGSGKSTLIHSILVPAIKSYLSKGDNKLIYSKNNYQSIAGVANLKTVIELDQSPIGRTPNSNPATYTGIFDSIRTLFSQLQDSQIRGYSPGRFSFNVKGGRCEDCEGNGVKKIEMHFLPDVFITCSECNGSRYNEDTLSILFKGKNISDILDLSIEEAFDFLKNQPKLNRILQTLIDVGLGYMKLGQPATTLSGGEAQRLKLSRELSKKVKGHCLYVLDEPTTGLHFQDIKILLLAINKLVENNHSVLIIEHNLDVIKVADHIIDLGPEGGKEGGNILFQGTPESLVKNSNSQTAKYLKPYLACK